MKERSMPMKKIGRSKLDVTKNKVVTLRMSGEEYKRLRDYSEDHQQTITDTIKEGVFLLYMTYD
jgi:hypothetical protein